MPKKQSDPQMIKSVPVVTRVDPATKAKLQALAKSSKRSEAHLAKTAIEAFVEIHAWQVREIELALEETRRGVAGVSHERMVEWLNSWGSDHELPPPEPEKPD